MNKTLNAFDFDSTLVNPVTFASALTTNQNGIVSIEGIFAEYLNKIKSFFYIVFAKEIYFVVKGENILIYDSKASSPMKSEFCNFITALVPKDMINYGLRARDLKLVWYCVNASGNHLELEPPPSYHNIPETIGTDINAHVVSDYNKAENTMIVTGRNEMLREHLGNRILELGMRLPNCGLFMFPGTGMEGIREFKVKTIINSIATYNWQVVHFYEDRKDWLDAVELAVNKEFPEIEFVSHHIS